MACGSDSYDCPHCEQRDVPNYEAVRVDCPGTDACRMYHAHYEIVHTDCPAAASRD